MKEIDVNKTDIGDKKSIEVLEESKVRPKSQSIE